MKTKIIEIKVLNDDILGEYLKKELNRKFYRKVKRLGQVYINGYDASYYQKVYKDDIIKIEYLEDNIINWDIYDKALDIYYEDDNYLVCYKEDNLLTIPTKAEPISLYQQILAYLKDSNHVSFLNRLDKETSGLILVAKDTYSANLLNPVKDNITRKYLALVSGKLFGEGIINKPIIKDINSNKRLIDESGKEAITHYKSIKVLDDSTIVELLLETGRTHQIRVHLSSIGHPIVGDTLYGGKEDTRMFLESYYLSFKNPYTKDVVTIKENKILWNEMN